MKPKTTASPKKHGGVRPLDIEEYKMARAIAPSGAFSPNAASVFRDAASKCPSISIREEVMEGQPCIDGTRIPVRSVLRAIEKSGSVEGARSYYSHLSQQQVKDALYFSQLILESSSGIDETSASD